MSDDCGNDCVTPPEFPRPIANRPGLAHIHYRIGTYADMLAMILDGINKDPILRSWTHRAPDDPGIALLESAAVVGDILTFYQELYANEAYLRTARWRESVGDLVRLVGYRLAPGLGGRATFAFTLRGDQPVTIPAGLPLKAQVTGLETPADFETVADSQALPALGKFNLYRPFKFPVFGQAETVLSVPGADLQAAGIKLEAKDRLLLLDTDAHPTNNAQIVIVKKVETSFDLTYITIEGSYSAGAGLASVRAYKLGHTYRHFGHNAPPKAVQINGTSVTLADITYFRNPTGPTGSSGATVISPSFLPIEIPLDKEVSGLATGSALLLQGANSGNSVVVRKIAALRSASMTWGALTGATTIVTVDQAWEKTPGHVGFGRAALVRFVLPTDIRRVVIHETAGPVLTLKPMRQVDPAADGSSLMFFGDDAAYQQLAGRKLALVRVDGIVLSTTVNTDLSLAASAAGSGPAFHRVYLAPALGAGFSLADFPLEQAQVTVYGNLVEATQGKTERTAELGNGDSRQTFQTFKLPKSPLTYLNHADATPPLVPELQVYVEDRLWQRVDSLFGHGPTEDIYIVREDAQGDSWVQFGDGETGRRLPSGIDNVVARFRTGSGAFGGLKPETTVQVGARLDHLDKVALPGIATGGESPESGDNARQAAPGKVQSLDRLVSLRDFESEALAIAGVAKVQARWSLVDNIPGVVVTVLMETGRAQELDQVRQILSAYNRCRGPQRYPVHVVAGKRLYVLISADVAFDPTYQPDLVIPAILQALGTATPLPAGQPAGSQAPATGLFALGQRAFGEPEYATRLAGVIQDVPGVQWTKVRQFFALGEADDPAQMVPGRLLLRARAVVPCDPSHILSLFVTHLRVNPVVVPADAARVC